MWVRVVEVDAMRQRSWGRVLLILRSFLGIVYLSNEAAQLFGFSEFSIGPWRQFLIDRSGVRSILASNVHSSDHGLGVARRMIICSSPFSWGSSC